MSSLFGKIIISSPDINDPNFEKTTIFIVEHNDRGAVGFILNITFKKSLNDLTEFIDCPPIPLYVGGPMDQENLFFIHRRPDLIDGGLLIKDGVYYGGDFQQVTTHLKNGSLRDNDLCLLIGYAGWDPEQLEEEIKEGSWIISDHSATSIFNK